MVVFRQEGEQAAWVGITVPKLHDVMIGGEALDAAPCRHRCFGIIPKRMLSCLKLFTGAM